MTVVLLCGSGVILTSDSERIFISYQLFVYWLVSCIAGKWSAVATEPGSAGEFIWSFQPNAV
jgi:hypothetical protein